MKSRRFLGSVDVVQSGLVFGWAIDLDRPSDAVSVDLYLDGMFVTRELAGAARPDLDTLGHGVHHGFRLPLPSMQGRIEVLFGGTLVPVPAHHCQTVNRPHVAPAAMNLVGSNRFIPTPSGRLASYVSGAAGGEEDLRLAYRRTGFHVAADMLTELTAAGANVTDPGLLIDIGTGCGRVTASLYAMTPHLHCLGLDIWREGIAWAQAHLSREGLSFGVLGEGTQGYDGSMTVPLPVADSAADFVVSSSLFTHLDLHAAAGYLHETRRVLKPGGLAYHTCFLRTRGDEAMQAMADRTRFSLIHEEKISFYGGDGYLDTFIDPEWLGQALRLAGLDVVRTRYGSWRDTAVGAYLPAQHQDVLILRRG